MIMFLCVYFVEAFFEVVSVAHAVYGGVFHAIWYPEVVNAGCMLMSADVVCDFSAAFDVFYPESSGLGVFAAEGEALFCLWVGEHGGVEVQLHVVFICPVYPVLEVFGLYLVSVYFVLSVHGVDVDSFGTRCEAEYLF